MADNNNDVENGDKINKQVENKKNGGQPMGDNRKQLAPVPFFHPSLKAVRRRVFLQWARTILILSTFILAILSLYWAVQFRVDALMPSLTTWVVDFDGKTPPYQTSDAIVGPSVVNTAKKIIASTAPRLGYTIKSAGDFNNDPMEVWQGIYNEDAWAAIIVNPNATSLLREALSNGNSSYDPADAAQIVIISARDENTYAANVLPSLNQFEHAVILEFGPLWVQMVAQEPWNVSRVPQAVNPAIGFTSIDLRPFSPPAATPSVTIGLIYLIIIAFFNFPFLMPIHAQFIKPGDHPPMRIPDWLIWRLFSNIMAYFLLSLFYSFVSLAFQIPFSNSPAPDTVPAESANAYGKGSFVVFWMLNWVGMTALGLPCENMGMILGFPWSAFFLIFWVITNVATAFYALELAPIFFRWGYAWPLHRIVEALRTILFGTHSRIGLDFGILFAWIGVSIVLFPIASFIMRWKMMRGL